MNREPKFHGYDAFRMHWVGDELFVSSRFIEFVLEPLGIQSMEVLNSSGKCTLLSVRQMVISEFVALGESDFREGEACADCGRTKLLPTPVDQPVKVLNSMSGHVARSRSYFGEGFSTFNLNFVSSEFRHLVLEASMRGVGFAATT